MKQFGIAILCILSGSGAVACKRISAMPPSSSAVVADSNAAGLKMDVRTISTISEPHGAMVISPDGTRAYGGGVFSPDSKHFATPQSSADNANQYVRLDQTSGPMFKMVQAITFSPDSRLVYGAVETGRKCVVVLDGIEQPCVPADFQPIQICFSADGRHTAYIETGPIGAGGDYRVCVDGKLWPQTFGQIFTESLCMSFDGKRTAVISDDTVFENGVAQTHCSSVSERTIVFSPDGKRMLYAGTRGSNQMLVENGKEIRSYGFVHARTITFSADSKRLAYAAYSGDEEALVFDPETGRSETVHGHPVVNIDGIETAGRGQSFVFSPDGKHVAYVQSEGYSRRSTAGAPQYGGGDVILDGKKLGGARFYVQYLQFSPDSRHVAYLTGGSADENPSLVFDGVDLPIPNANWANTLIFRSPDTLTALVEFESSRATLANVEMKLHR